MNIDDLTYGDLKRIAALFSHQHNEPDRPNGYKIVVASATATATTATTAKNA